MNTDEDINLVSVTGIVSVLLAGMVLLVGAGGGFWLLAAYINSLF